MPTNRSGRGTRDDDSLVVGYGHLVARRYAALGNAVLQPVHPDPADDDGLDGVAFRQRHGERQHGSVDKAALGIAADGKALGLEHLLEIVAI
ncbi:UNVERIFIED_ORG: hypothetical protein GGE64_005632 [Rhizobium etli]